MSSANDKVIEVDNLKKHFLTGFFRRECVKAVDGVSFSIARGTSMGVIGESGSGKSTLGRCILRLLDPTSGEVLFLGQDLSSANGNLRALRRQMQIIFQDADGSLNPRMKAIDLLIEPLRVHRLITRKSREKVAEVIERVGLSNDLLDRYPGELSGGQRQRIAIGRAIGIDPCLVVADEAAASLDPLAQAQMIDLFTRLQRQHGISFLHISHDLNMVRRLTTTVAVMYHGKFVEAGRTDEIFSNPVHPYTQSLIAAVPRITRSERRKTYAAVDDSFTGFSEISGCHFHPFCPYSESICARQFPEKTITIDGHWVWCHNAPKKKRLL